MENLLGIIGNPSKIRTPRVIQWLQQSKASALVWTAMRVWLGVMWIQAGVAKLWGAESQAFMHNGGAGVVGIFLTLVIITQPSRISYLGFLTALAALASFACLPALLPQLPDGASLYAFPGVYSLFWLLF